MTADEMRHAAHILDAEAESLHYCNTNESGEWVVYYEGQADREAHDEMRALAAKLREMADTGWQPIETAPRGSGMNGPHDVRDPSYVAPPELLLYGSEGYAVGYYDWYYHPGYGSGGYLNESAWRYSTVGGPIDGITHWRPLSPPPEAEQ